MKQDNAAPEDLDMHTDERHLPDGDTSSMPMQPNDDNSPENTGNDNDSEHSLSGKHRWRWLRVSLRTLACILVFLLLLPVLVYIPPLQTLLKNIACSQISSATGMDVSLQRFRLRFPVDVSLDDLTVIEATGDTMVHARTAEIDIKLLPLFHLDVQVKKLRLDDGYYRMLSKDSSMLLKIHAPYFDASPGTSADISRSLINLDEVTLRGGRLDLYMDVWKSKPEPPSPGVFVINANKLRLEDFTFSMSMLPTIDSLGLYAKSMEVEGGLVDLKNNLIDIRKATLAGGSATYIVPTAEYVKSHPAPPPSPYPSTPIIIKAHDIALSGFDALYATKGAKPLPGFDPSYIQFSGLAINLQEFYNEQTIVRLPITALEGRERSGLTITSGSGAIDIDTAGIGLRQLQIHTTASDLRADAYLSMGAMAMNPKSPFSVNGKFLIGMSDIRAFMPATADIIRRLGRYGALRAEIDASGSMDAIAVPKLIVKMPGVLDLSAKGRIAHAMDMKKLDASLDFYGNLMAPSPMQALMELKGFDIPPFIIKGKATAKGDNYGANFKFTSPAGNVALDGRIGLSSQQYFADVKLNNLNVGLFVPDAGIGHLTGNVYAKGRGFDIERRNTYADVDLQVDRVEYNHYPLTAINAKASLTNGIFGLDLTSDNDALAGMITGSGSISKDLYDVDVTADLTQLDMHLLGLSSDTTVIHGVVMLQGSISPARMLCNLSLTGHDLYYASAGSIYDLPGAVSANLLSAHDSIHAEVRATGLSAEFSAPSGLKQFMPRIEKTINVLTHQLSKEHKLDMEALHELLPKFNLMLQASGNGLLGDVLNISDLAVDTVSANISNEDRLLGDIYTRGISTPTLTLDTITAHIAERGQLLDYALHLGNAPGNLDEYADVNLSGYVGQQRLSAFLRQKNNKGETGYRLGLTTFFTDTLITVHFTPLRATIAYLPWTFNDDNYLTYDMKNRLDANLSAESHDSRISVKTIDRPGKELPSLSLQLENIRLQDFIAMVPGAPDITGVLNTDLNIVYEDNAFNGGGTLGLKDFCYEGRKVADFTGKLDAGVDLNGNTSAHALLDIDGHKALDFRGTLIKTDNGIEPSDMTIGMEDFPLTVANAFLPADMAQLSGHLSGEMNMSGGFTNPLLNGAITCHEVKVNIPMMAGTLTLDSVPLEVVNNVVDFNNFDIYGAKNSLVINGVVDAQKMNDVRLDLSLNGRDFMLIDNDKKAKSQIYGKILLNADATVKGSLNLLNVAGNLSVLRGTNAFYTLSELQQLDDTQTDEVVKFVQFNDTTLESHVDSLPSQSIMRITAGLNISNGVQVTVNLNNSGSNCVQLTPSGSLSYFQNYMGDMRLNGQINLGTGFARYSVPAIGEKKFNIDPESYVVFNGDIMNPTLHIMASDMMKSVANTGGNSSRVLNFLVTISATGTLSQPNVLFDLSTEDDISIENELQSMSADQRSNEAMNMILYGRYMGPGAASSGGAGAFATNALYGFLTSQLNSWAANNIRGVELSFGIDQYNTMTDGRNGTSTSYSYQVSKSLFNNKFKIVVGGNYSTDQNSDQDIAQNLISNLSFEYILKQTNSTSVYAKLFRHSNYESILEGEITETGVGFVMQRKLSDLHQLFNWLRRRRRRHVEAGHADPPTPTSAQKRTSISEALPTDTIVQ